jgi:hypothetical protein
MDSSPTEEMASVYNTASVSQKIAAVTAILSALIALGMTIAWADKHDTDKKYLGGLNWDRLVFNWHPVMMISGMVLCFVCSLVSYRVVNMPKVYTKIMHAALHLGAIVCTLIGLSAVVSSHNYQDKNKGNGFSANLYTLHSLLGVCAMVLYFSNYIMGFVHFLTSMASPEMRANFKPNHVFFGIFSLFLSTIAVLTGITEKSTFLGCGYPAHSADWNPATRYHNLPDGCKLANGIGIMVLVTVFLCAFALLGPGVKEKDDKLLNDVGRF